MTFIGDRRARPPRPLDVLKNSPVVRRGQTALHKAAHMKRRSICCMLVAGGARLTIRDHNGNSARDLALIAEDRELAAYLYSEFFFFIFNFLSLCFSFVCRGSRSLRNGELFLLTLPLLSGARRLAICTLIGCTRELMITN